MFDFVSFVGRRIHRNGVCHEENEDQGRGRGTGALQVGAVRV